MDGTMISEVEEVGMKEVEDMNQNYGESLAPVSGPSKGFIALVVGGIAAVAAIGATMAVKHRNKKKKNQSLENPDSGEDEYDEYECYEDLDLYADGEPSEGEKSEGPAEKK